MPAIRRQINIATSPRAVWNALTTADGLAGWWAASARVEARAGGRIVLVPIGNEDARAEGRGLIHLWRPTSHLEIAFDRVGESELKGSLVAFKLARDGEETRLTLVHSGGDALDDAERRLALDKGWDKALATLQAMLDKP